jgi:excisionase family DNA binding protein
MAATIITTEDLQIFKTELFTELKKLLAEKPKNEPRGYMKTWEVIRDFKVSKGKLQSMRASGELPFTRLGKNILFEYSDLKRLLDENKIQHQPVGQGKNRFSIRS